MSLAELANMYVKIIYVHEEETSEDMKGKRK